jgi:hypothetical protein
LSVTVAELRRPAAIALSYCEYNGNYTTFYIINP